MLTIALTIALLVLLYAVLYLYRRRGDGVHDLMTGLPNREFFQRYLQQCAARTTRRPDYGFALLLMDIRGFPDMRRKLGRFAAEEILADFAERVYWCIRPSDLLTRLEGDNFGIVLEDVSHVTDATRVAMRVQSSMTEAVTLAAREVPIDINVGVTISKPGTNEDWRALIEEAERSLARAVLEHRPYVVSDAGLDALSITEHALEQELGAALDDGQLRVAYSPIMQPVTMELFGFTALLQWDHPQHGLMNARQFIHLAEASREILRMGRWAVGEACTALLHLAESSDRPLMMTVNVGVTELERGDPAGVIAAHLGESLPYASRLRVEIPAAALSEMGSGLEVVTQRLKSMGVGLHLDHLAASSIPLVRANELGVSGVRLSLMAYDPDDLDAPAAFMKLLTTTQTFAREIVVEGVESPGGLAFVQAVEPGVLAQGLLFGPPMSLAAAVQMAQSPAQYEARVD